MNILHKIVFSYIVATSSSIFCTINQEEIENRNLEIQFAPIYETPFSQEKDDLYFAELLQKIIKLDHEIHHDPTSMMKKQLKDQSMKLVSLPEFIIQEKSNYVLVNHDKSFGWSAPGAIASALWYNGAAATPNEFVVTIEKSTEFPGQYKAIIKGNGLYPHEKNRVKSAQSELTNFINNGPIEVSKYVKLENISSAENAISNKKNIKKKLPTLQGNVKCDKYLHGTDISGVIYFDGVVAAYLLQEINGNRYKKNTIIQTSQPMSALSKIDNIFTDFNDFNNNDNKNNDENDNAHYDNEEDDDKSTEKLDINNDVNDIEDFDNQSSQK